MMATLKNIKHWWLRNRWKAWLALWGLALALVLVLLLCRGGADEPKSPKPLTADEVNGLLEVEVPRAVSNEWLSYTGFIVNFNASMHVPNSVSYVLTRERLDGTVERYGEFEQAPGVAGCPLPSAYRRSGYARGHMAPAQDMAWSEESMHASFYMTNVCPQSQRLNEDAWAKLEEKVREWVQRDSVLLVVTGPVLEPGLERIEGSGVVIPRRFYKVILTPLTMPMRSIGFVYDNGKCSGGLDDHAVAVDEVERLTGLNFFMSLPDELENRVESRCNLLEWTRH
jgi:endonuclease G